MKKFGKNLVFKIILYIFAPCFKSIYKTLLFLGYVLDIRTCFKT
jgi:hypothetical protein